MKKKRLGFITILYGMATILVTFGHSHPLHCGYPDWMRQVIAFIYTFHMALFFLIAGILLDYTLSGNTVFAWWVPKGKKLIVPYIILTVIAWIPKVMLGSLMNDNMEVSTYNFIKILFAPRSGIWGHFWFIPVYLLLMLGCGYLWIHIKNCSIAVIGGVLLIAVLLNIFPVNINWFGIKDITQNLLYVLIGCYISELIIRTRKQYFNIVLGLITFASSAILFIMTGNTQMVILNRVICILMQYAMLTFGLNLEQFRCRILRMIGSHSFTIYVYSWPVQAVVEMIMVVVLDLPWYIAFIVMFISGMFVPLVLYWGYTRFIIRNKFMDAMIGVR